MRKLFTDYDVWSFHKPEPEVWNWKRTSPDGEILLEGRGAFGSFDDCVADARRHGYTGSISVTS
ncbi:MAG: hypothetical protein JWM26_596 [Betaproteobacteria bacterium]|jgi:hypothetical protein|nr:hypothetical protein [Betaproteobacteria bacterium]